MQQVNTVNPALGAHKTADDRAAHISGLGLAIRTVWARLLEASASQVAVEAQQETDQSQVADSGPGILANYYDGARDRVSAAEPVLSFRKLAP